MEAFLIGVVMALGIVVVGLVLCGVAITLTAAGVHLGPVAMTLVPLLDVLEQGAWFPLVFLAAVPLGCPWPRRGHTSPVSCCVSSGIDMKSAPGFMELGGIVITRW